MEQFMTIREAAATLGVTKAHAYNLMYAGELEAVEGPPLVLSKKPITTFVTAESVFKAKQWREMRKERKKRRKGHQR